MGKRLLIVEDEFIEANNLRRILKKAGYTVLEIAMSVSDALAIMEKSRPDFVLLDIFLKGPETGIQLAETLGKMKIPFIYLSANSDREILVQAKKTQPYGFLVKPFREKDVVVMLDIASDMHDQKVALDGPRQEELLTLQRDIRNCIAQDLHDQIGSSLSSITVYSEAAKIYSKEEQNPELQSVLDNINNTANDLVLEISDIVWAITPRSDHLESVLQRIRRYALPLCNAKNIVFEFKYDATLSDIVIGMKAKNNLFLIIKEAINNSIKHSECNTLTLEIYPLVEAVEVVVKDNGRGFLTEELYHEGHPIVEGNGLNNIVNRAKELNAALEITSVVGNGTMLKLNIGINALA